MIKFILYILFTFSTTICSAQYFAPTGATWYYGQGLYWGFPLTESFMRFEVTGDTVINGVSCQVINKEDMWWCSGRPTQEYTYYSNDTVYFYDTTFAMFQVLYDFNSTPGQYWEIIVPDNSDLDTVRITVDSTDLITINSQSLKRMYVKYELFGEFQSYYYFSEIIERLGDMNYMFNFFAYESIACDANWPTGLRCYEDTILGYHDTGIAESCTYQAFWSVDELSSTEKELVRIIDLTGRETVDKQNTLLIYIYSDGTREKVFKVKQ